jgi:hypothetical protein
MTTHDLLARATATAERLRAAGKHDLANRFSGRAEVVITRHAARQGTLIPTLYVSSDGQWLTTWPGNRVARLYVTGKARGFNCELTCYSATIEGRHYYGRGLGPCMYLNLKAGKRVAS